MQSRESVSLDKHNTPEEYPKEKVDLGFSRLSHVRRVSTPCLGKMRPRNNSMYYMSEFQNLAQHKDLIKVEVMLKKSGVKLSPQNENKGGEKQENNVAV